MNLISVKSSNISQIGFDENFKLTINSEPMTIMRIVFANGRIYDYYRVEKEVYEDLLKADSIGMYFHKHIKNSYHYEKHK